MRSSQKILMFFDIEYERVIYCFCTVPFGNLYEEDKQYSSVFESQSRRTWHRKT